MKKPPLLTKFAIYFTFFADNLSWSIVFPIFAPLFLDVNDQIFSPDVTPELRTTILGFFLMAFPLAQFFGSPILGDYADKAGRRKALLISILFTLVGLLLSGWSIYYKKLTLLFVSRLITGAFAGNLSICLASIADLSTSEGHKVKNFGYLSVTAGLSFIIGAYVGGKFSDPNINDNFNSSLPLLIASCFTLLNLFFVWLGFKETGEISLGKKFDFLEGIHNIQQALKIEKIKSLFFIYFLILFSWLLVFQFTPVYLIQLFNFSNSKIGDVAAYLGVCWAVGSGLLNRILICYFDRLRILEFFLISFMIFCVLIVFPSSTLYFLILLGLSVIFAGVTWPICTSLISSKAKPSDQGKILGISQSVQSLAMAISPLIGGVADFFHAKLFFIIAAFSCFLASIVYFKVKK
jgi:MFS transporter, DHA1 family, tetracycline resistance protein